MRQSTSPRNREASRAQASTSAVPEHVTPGPDELFQLLLENEQLPEVLSGLARLIADSVADHALGCGIAVDRPKRSTVVAASDHATERLMASWLARRESPLRSVLGGSITAIGPERFVTASSLGSVMVLPIRVDADVTAALVLRGTSCAGDARAMLGAVGDCRRAVSWVLRLALRYSHQRELAEHRAAAMENRTMIDIAIGIVMDQNRCSPDAAFEILKRASNARNHKVAAVASGIVARVTEAEISTRFEA